MAEFTLKKKEAETLKINIGDTSFHIPLQGSLTLKEALLVGKPEGAYSYLKKTVPKEIFDNLTADQYKELINVWNEESLKASGKTLGES